MTRRGQINIYTVLMLVALIALGTTAGFLWWKNVTLTEDDPGQEGGNNPFFFADPDHSTRQG